MARSDDKEAEAAALMNAMTLYGGPEVGFNTNPRTEKEPCFIEVDGQKIVCIAQGGECRYNYNYYSPGLSDKKSWTTPIIDESCPNQCCYKVIVCDDHDEKCEGSITYYPRYNKFCGQFKRYCRNFDKFIKEGKVAGKKRTGRKGNEKNGKGLKTRRIEGVMKDGKRIGRWEMETYIIDKKGIRKE